MIKSLGYAAPIACLLIGGSVVEQHAYAAVKSLSTSQTVTRVFPNRNENVQVFIRIENIFNWENADRDHQFAVEFAGWLALRK